MIIHILNMYSRDQFEGIVNQLVDKLDFFVVDIRIGKGNKISVFIDSEKGVHIEDCVTVSRHIESTLDREEEDFELEVSSAGISSPFKVERQYLKNLGKEVEVLLQNGEKLKGKLKSFKNDQIELETSKKVKVESSKKKVLKVENIEEIKSTKLLLLF